MTLHLLKTAAGVGGLEDLRRRQESATVRSPEGRRLVKTTTRFMPKRAEELLAGGSIYWIVKGRIAARNEVVALEMGQPNAEGRRRCQIYLDPDLVQVAPVRKRAIQGWRYLEAERAPADLPRSADPAGEPMPAALAAELREMGLL